MLDLARIEAGRLSLSPEPVQIKDAVKEALDLVRPIASLQNIRLSVDFLLRKPVRSGRSAAPKQVLLNLLSNAIKFNRSNGMIVLRCEETQNDRLRIEVVDTGSGIDEEGLKKIFMPFERLSADRNAIGGNGIRPRALQTHDRSHGWGHRCGEHRWGREQVPLRTLVRRTAGDPED